MATANVSWAAVTGATGYKVEYKLSSASIWTLATSNTTSLTTAITGLMAGTSYDFRVTTHCVVGDSTGTILTQFTPCSFSSFTDDYYSTASTFNTIGGGYYGTTANRTNTSYGTSGTRIYQVSGYGSNGIATLTTTDLTGTSSFMNNPTGILSAGRMNAVGLWGANNCMSPTFDTLSTQFVGFTYTLYVPSYVGTHTYYIAVGSDDNFKITVDGATIIQPTALSSNIYSWWNVYPITLTPGVHVIGMYGYNTSSSHPSFGAEIYDNTQAQIIAAASPSDLTILFSTINEFCQGFSAGTNVGYTCPTGFLLDTSQSPFVCIKST